MLTNCHLADYIASTRINEIGILYVCVEHTIAKLSNIRLLNFGEIFQIDCSCTTRMSYSVIQGADKITDTFQG